MALVYKYFGDDDYSSVSSSARSTRFSNPSLAALASLHDAAVPPSSKSPPPESPTSTKVTGSEDDIVIGEIPSGMRKRVPIDDREIDDVMHI